MATAIYTLKCCLLIHQLSPAIQEHSKFLHRISNFIAPWWTRHFLQSVVYEISPRNDLSLIIDMLSFSSYDQEVSEAALSKLKNHLDYLNPHHIIVSLVDIKLDATNREMVAKELLKFKRPDSFKLGYPKAADFKSFDKTKLKLAHFVNSESYLLFELLDITDLEWLKDNCEKWPQNADYLKLRDFVMHSEITNDPAERAIKLFQVLQLFFLPGFYQTK